MNLVDKDKQHLWHPFTQMREWEPLVIARADGNWLIDTDGRRYLDGISSLWVNLHGHRRRELDEALRAQLDRVAHSTLLGLSNVPAIELAERLAALTGLPRVFYSDSGSSAVEIALKMAFQAQQLRGNSRRTKFLALENAYHGDTLGAVSVGGIDLFHEIFHPLLFHVKHIPPTVDALERALADEELAAFIVEPLIQGAAGMLLQPPGFLRAARELCTRHGVYLICDEVATGFGRTGTMFAVEQEGVRPDLMTLAKGITGGYLPLAATLAGDEIYQAFLGAYAEKKTFFHGHSYTGNPLACAVALASLEIFERDRVLHALRLKTSRLAALLHDKIKPMKPVVEIRRRGFMVGIELGPYAWEEAMGARVCKAARARGVMLRPLGNVVVLLPPLSITDEELDLLVAATAESIAEICS